MSLESTNPVAPYVTWARAATNIQDAVDAARAGDNVLVTNGVYAVGSRDGNRVEITNSIRLESVNGPSVTTIEGSQFLYPTNSMRCLFLGTNAVLSGFTLTNGCMPYGQGGGVLCEPSGVVTNCILTGNRAETGGGACGGSLYSLRADGKRGFRMALGLLRARSTTAPLPIMEAGLASARSSTVQLTGNSYTVWASTLYNCLVTDNEGGSSGVFYNCTVVGNNGGVSGTFFNSILYYNSGSNYSAGATLNYCLTTPLPTNGVGNITGPHCLWTWLRVITACGKVLRALTQG